MKDIDVPLSFTLPKVFMNTENDKFYVSSVLWERQAVLYHSKLLVLSKGMKMLLYIFHFPGLLLVQNYTVTVYKYPEEWCWVTAGA